MCAVWWCVVLCGVLCVAVLCAHKHFHQIHTSEFIRLQSLDHLNVFTPLEIIFPPTHPCLLLDGERSKDI